MTTNDGGTRHSPTHPQGDMSYVTGSGRQRLTVTGPKGTIDVTQYPDFNDKFYLSWSDGKGNSLPAVDNREEGMQLAKRLTGYNRDTPPDTPIPAAHAPQSNTPGLPPWPVNQPSAPSATVAAIRKHAKPPRGRGLER